MLSSVAQATAPARHGDQRRAQDRRCGQVIGGQGHRIESDGLKIAECGARSSGQDDEAE
jgi:hypothetical protein